MSTPEIEAARAGLADALVRLGRAVSAWPPPPRGLKATWAAMLDALVSAERWLDQLHRLRAAEPLDLPELDPDEPVALADAAGWASAVAAEVVAWTREDLERADTSARRSAALTRGTAAQRRAAVAARRSARYAADRDKAAHDAEQDVLAAQAEALELLPDDVIAAEHAERVRAYLRGTWLPEDT